MNTVSASLIKEPRFSGKDSIASRISGACVRVCVTFRGHDNIVNSVLCVADMIMRLSYFDPEFVLKIAVYVRDELNIRSTGYSLNFSIIFSKKKKF